MTCPFCNLSQEINRVIFITTNFIFFSDLKPIVQGHSLLIPKAHIRREIDIPINLYKEYVESNEKAHLYIKNEFGNEALTFVNAPQDQSVQHLHKHFIPGIFGPLGVDKALREFIKNK